MRDHKSVLHIFKYSLLAFGKAYRVSC